jgi:hypothetical protein
VTVFTPVDIETFSRCFGITLVYLNQSREQEHGKHT